MEPRHLTADLTDPSAWHRAGQQSGRHGQPRDSAGAHPLREALQAQVLRAASEHRRSVIDQLSRLDDEREHVHARVTAMYAACPDAPRVEQGLRPMIAYARTLDRRREQVHDSLTEGLADILEAGARCDAAWRQGCQQEHAERIILAATPLTLPVALYRDIPDLVS